MSGKHVVFYDWFIDPRAGGPTGYLANLRFGLDRSPPIGGTDIVIERRRKTADMVKAEKGEYSLKVLKGLTEFFLNIDAMRIDEEAIGRILRHDPVSIHVHTAIEAVKVINSLKGRYNGKIIFTSHCPESSGKEVADIWRARGFGGEEADKLEQAARLVEAFAFRHSDIWMFPSKEAMDPYFATIPQFGEWAATKQIEFVPTGANAIAPSLSKQEARDLWGIGEDKRVVAFIGRHNEVKGYDMLIDVGMELLRNHEDVVILVAGKPEGAKTPEHDRWIELGWYPEPANVLAACDLYVLPNRMTYFDLILLEALSAGAAILASKTGGNKSVEAANPGTIMTFEPNVGAFKSAIEEALWNDEVLSRYRLAARQTYLENYTTEEFATRYSRFVNKVSKRRLVIHAGFRKTATSSVQKFLSSMDEERYSVLYPRSGRMPDWPFAHHKLVEELRDGDTGSLDQVEAEVAQSSARTVVISCEDFSVVGYAHALTPIIERFPYMNVEIVLYVRDHGAWCASFYAEEVRRGRTSLDPTSYIRFFQDRLSYIQRINEIKELNPNVELTIKQMPPDDVVPQIVEYLIGAQVEDVTNLKENSALNPVFVFALRELIEDGVFDEASAGEYARRAFYLSEASAPSSSSIFTNVQMKEAFERFYFEDLKLSKEYLGLRSPFWTAVGQGGVLPHADAITQAKKAILAWRD